MNFPRFRAAALLATLALAACSGLKDALTAHVDLAARAGSRELSVTKLAEMMNTAQAPPRKDVGLAIANLWVNYSLLAQAVAKGDTLGDPKVVDDAMWMQIAQMKSRKYFDIVQKGFPVADSSTFERHYNDGNGVLVARHILWMGNRDSLKPAQLDSVRREALKVRKLLTSENFAKMAEKYTQDPGSKANGGEYVFPRGKMVPEFEQTVLKLKPGEISDPVQTMYGFHVITRETWAEARDKFSPEFRKASQMTAETTFVSAMERNAKVEVKQTAAKTIRAVASDLDAHRNDNTVIATSRATDLTAARLARWIAAFPPQQRVRENIAQAPDSVMPTFARNLMRQELLIHAADSAKMTVDTADLAGIRRTFAGSVANALNGLNIAPAQLKDSAKTDSERERLAIARIEAYLSKLLKNETQFVDVPEPVAIALRGRFDARVVTAGIDRAAAEAGRLKAQADSAKAKSLPPSVVPMPGQAPPPAAAAAPPKGAPEGAAKAPPAKKP